MTGKRISDYDFFKQLTDIPCVEAIHVFGSRARETYRPESDLDLAIFCPDASDAEWAAILKIVKEADLLTPIDVVRLDALAEGSMKNEIHQTRALLYYRSPRTYSTKLTDNLEVLDQKCKKMEALLAASPRDNAAILKLFYNLFTLVIRMVRRALLSLGERHETPVMILRHANSMGWLGDKRETWEQMVHDWWCCKPQCAPELAEEIASRIEEYMVMIHDLFGHIARVVEYHKQSDGKTGA